MPVYMNCRYCCPYPVNLAVLRHRAERLLSLQDLHDRELSILLLDDWQIQELNRQYRGKNKATNVLAFAMQEAAGGQSVPLGDVVLSVDTAQREAMRQNSTLHHRLTQLLIHGFFHLLGYDHERGAAEEKAMEQAESEALGRLFQKERREVMTHLAINVDHVATLRQARGIDEPDPVTAAAICELAGAEGIVVHLREDRRHIQDRDVRLLRQTVKTKLNLEMGAAEEIIAIALEIDPDMVTLVPEKRKELTTEGGLNVYGQKKRLKEVIARFSDAAIPVSLFIDPDSKQVKAAREIGATFVEIHTGRYCDAVNEKDRDLEFNLVARAAEEAFEMGLRVNAGHGLNYRNTQPIAELPVIEELSIGHAIMARAILVGLDQAVREMLEICRRAG
ncbi:MAG: pyridoxine 5'-phosphate synthase [Deltaproteobacteria bacterium]